MPDAPAVHVKRSISEIWSEVGRDLSKLKPIGRHLAEQLGHPDWAERPMVWEDGVTEIGQQEEPGGKLMLRPVIISTDQENRVGDVVHQSWDLDDYNDYRIVLLGHGFMDPARDIIGKNERLWIGEVEGHQALMGEDELLPNETGQRLHKTAQFVGKIGISVGFDPLEFSMRQREGGPPGIDYLYNRKVEHSVCTIPMNRLTLARAVVQGAMDQRFLRYVSVSDQGPPATPEEQQMLDEAGATLLAEKLGDVLLQVKAQQLAATLMRIQRQ